MFRNRHFTFDFISNSVGLRITWEGRASIQIKINCYVLIILHFLFFLELGSQALDSPSSLIILQDTIKDLIIPTNNDYLRFVKDEWTTDELDSRKEIDPTVVKLARQLTNYENE